jgi:hypothetical protein
MARYRKIDPRIWNDAKFSALSDRAKLVFFMLLTHPNMTAIGAMRGTAPGLAAELGWEPEAFAEAFREVLSKGMAEYDERACLIALPKFIQYNQPESPNVVKAWVGALDLLPECDLKTRVVVRAKEYAEGLKDGFSKALPEAFAKSMPIPEPEPEPEQEQKEKTLSAGADGDGKPGEQNHDGQQMTRTIPVKAILAAYHEYLPMLPQVRVMTDPRKRKLKARWCEDVDRQSVEYWQRFFGYVAKSDFLTGRSGTWTGCDFEWLIESANHVKVIEGKYENREAVA